MTVLLNDESPQLVSPVPEDAPPHQASSSHPPKRELRWNNIYFDSILPFLCLVILLRLPTWIVLVSFIENPSHQSLFDASTDSDRATVLFFRPNLHLFLLQFPTKHHIFSKRMPLHIF